MDPRMHEKPPFACHSSELKAQATHLRALSTALYYAVAPIPKLHFRILNLWTAHDMEAEQNRRREQVLIVMQTERGQIAGYQEPIECSPETVSMNAHPRRWYRGRASCT